MPAPSAPDAGVAEGGGEAVDPQRHGRAAADECAVRAGDDDLAGVIRSDEGCRVDQHDAPAPARVLEHAPCLLAGLGIAAGGMRRDEAERGLAAGHAGHYPERARGRVGVADHAARHHVARVADAAARMRERGRGDAQRLRHGDDGDAGFILADARIVMDDGARMRLKREVGRIAPAVRSRDDHAAAGGVPELGGRVGQHDFLGQIDRRHIRSSSARVALGASVRVFA